MKSLIEQLRISNKEMVTLKDAAELEPSALAYNAHVNLERVSELLTEDPPGGLQAPKNSTIMDFLKLGQEEMFHVSTHSSDQIAKAYAGGALAHIGGAEYALSRNPEPIRSDEKLAELYDILRRTDRHERARAGFYRAYASRVMALSGSTLTI